MAGNLRLPNLALPFTTTVPQAPADDSGSDTGAGTVSRRVATISPAVTPVGTYSPATPAQPVPQQSSPRPGLTKAFENATPIVSEAPTPETGFPAAAVVAVTIFIILLAGIAYLVRRWWIRRQNPALFRDYD